MRRRRFRSRAVGGAVDLPPATSVANEWGQIAGKLAGAIRDILKR
jgi:hypothetical protein